MSGELLAVDHHRVAGIVSALIADDVIHPSSEEVCGFSFTLIAPLGTEDHNGWHLLQASSQLSIG